MFQILGGLRKVALVPFGHGPSVECSHEGACFQIGPPLGRFPLPAAFLTINELLIPAAAFRPTGRLVISIGKLDPCKEAVGILFQSFLQVGALFSW